MKKQYDQAIAETERAIALDPNDPSGHMALAEIFTFHDPDWRNHLPEAEAIVLMQQRTHLLDGGADSVG